MELGPVEITLSDADLAEIGRATAFEAQAKTFLSLALKRLTDVDHEQWIKLDKRQFQDIVQSLTNEVADKPDLKKFFDRIERNHKRWRETRNLVVHTMWGNGSDGLPTAYCYRRSMLADRNDIVRAVNDCFWLAKEARQFAYQVALAVSEGKLDECKNGEGKVSIKVQDRWIAF